MAPTGPYMGPSLNVCPYFYRQLKKKVLFTKNHSLIPFLLNLLLYYLIS